MPACAACGWENPENARFCSGCGSALVATPGREERKVVTVLFCDLVGFTARAELLDPEDVRVIQERYFERVRGEIEGFGGTVEKYVGDAVLSIFGAPTAHEDDPERAVRAAFALRDAIADLNEGSPGLDLHVRIAAATGPALVALDARFAAGEGMVSGDVVNTAARLQTAAPVDGVIVDETTYRATERQIEYRPSEPVVAKGKSAPVPVWEAVAPRARFGVDVDQAGHAPLVGRRAELGLVRDVLERARATRTSQLVTLVGEPGIGKSRLVWEVAQLVDAEPESVFWRQGRSLPYGDGVAFWALGEIVKAHAGILETDTAERAEEKLALAVAGLIADPDEVGWVAAQLGPLVGVGREDEGGERSESFAAWRRFFEALAERHPTVLVLEDLHWADEGLLDFVEHLLDWASGVPLLVLGTARPELLARRPAWGGGKRNAVSVSLEALSEAETAELLGALLNGEGANLAARDAVLAHSGGNPLYAEEYVRMLRERGADASPALPESVQGIIAARLDGLSSEEKNLLQEASVVGKVFWAGALAAIAGEPRWTVEERLLALERKEFVRRQRRTSVAAETEYAFRHGLVRDVAYGQIPRERRAELHRRAAAWIESLPADRSEDRADMLLHHYVAALEAARAAGSETGELEERARESLRAAGDRAASLQAHGPALDLYRQALALWEPGADGRADLLRKMALMATSSRRSLLPAEVEAAREELAGDPEGLAQVENALAASRWVAGERVEGLEHLRRMAELLEPLPPSWSKGRMMADRSISLMLLGRYEESIETAQGVLADARELGLLDVEAAALNAIGTSRASTGDLAGIADLEAALEAAIRANASVQIVRSYRNLGSVIADLGDLERAHELNEACSQQARRFGYRFMVLWTDVERAVLHYVAGRWDAALETIEEFLAATADEAHYMQSASRDMRALIALGRGDVASASADARLSLAYARGALDPQVLRPSLAVSATVAYAAGDEEGASALLSEIVHEWGGDTANALSWLPSLVSVAYRLGRGKELLDRLRRVEVPTPIVQAALAYLRGDPRAAADLYERIGLLTDEAGARLEAGRELAARGDAAVAREELERSLAFWRSAGATARVAEAEALLAGT